MKYTVVITAPVYTDVEANSPDEAIEIVRVNLIANKQMKPCDPVTFSVIEEARVVEDTAPTATTDAGTTTNQTKEG